MGKVVKRSAKQSVQYEDIEPIFGKKFGKLTALPIVFVEDVQDENGTIMIHKRKYIIKCQCDCGNYYYANRLQLLNGRVNSCGCEKKERLSQRNKEFSKKYSDSDSQVDSPYNKLYNSWSAMKHRCLYPSDTHYNYYGGRGITICEDWLDYEKFKEWAIKNGWQNDLTIDRIDYDKNYEPSNCRWVDMKTQHNNTSSNKFLTYKGKTQSLALWCEELNLSYGRIKARLNDCNMSVEEAFERRLYESHESYLIRKACEEQD